MKPNGAVWLLLGLAVVPACAQTHDHVQIAQQNIPAVVAVNVLKKDGSSFTGTGFVLTENGLIATSNHVLKDAVYTNLTFSNAAVSGEAIPIAQNEAQDIALLKIQARQLPHVTLGNSDTVQAGQTITVIGNPRRLQNTVTSGLISQVRQQKNGTFLFQISAPISPSSSGSPVFNAQGHVIAMAFASLSGTDNQNLNFAVPANYVREMAQQALYMPEEPNTSAYSQNPFLRHVQKSWQILKRLMHRWFGGTKSTQEP